MFTLLALPYWQEAHLAALWQIIDWQVIESRYPSLKCLN